MKYIQWRIYIVKFWTRPPPGGSKFFQFHAVFGKIWQNRMLAPPLGSWRPLLGEILDPPLINIAFNGKWVRLTSHIHHTEGISHSWLWNMLYFSSSSTFRKNQMKNIITILLPRKLPDNNVETTQIQAIQNVPSSEKLIMIFLLALKLCQTQHNKISQEECLLVEGYRPRT